MEITSKSYLSQQSRLLCGLLRSRRGAAHSFLTTRMRNVAGLSTSEAQKSSDMFGKCRYLDEITGGAGRGVRHGHAREQFHDRVVHGHAVLAIQHLAAEKADPLRLLGIHLWRDTTAIELAPEGTGYRARTRFAKFFNLPELMSMFKEVADIKPATSSTCLCRKRSLKRWWQNPQRSKRKWCRN